MIVSPRVVVFENGTRESIQNDAWYTVLYYGSLAWEVGGNPSVPWLALVCLVRAVWMDLRPEWADGFLACSQCEDSLLGKCLVKIQNLLP